jgi:hypothetical protein
MRVYIKGVAGADPLTRDMRHVILCLRKASDRPGTRYIHTTPWARSRCILIG